MSYQRQLNLDKISGSLFLFGPRMTGKTFLLRRLHSALFIDLLDPEIELSFSRSPVIFWEKLRALRKNDLVIVDEVQRVPVLLDYVQKGIEEIGLRFILSGSSARKLRRGSANLLGGRALDLRLYPLTTSEIGKSFELDMALSLFRGVKPYMAYAEIAVYRNGSRPVTRCPGLSARAGL